MQLKTSTNRLIIGSALLMVATANQAFFRHVWGTFSSAPWGLAHTLSLGLVLLALTTILLSLVCVGRATKSVLGLFFVVAALGAYFMDTYNVVIDSDMIGNVMATNMAEAGDLLTWKLAWYLLLLGLLPTLSLAFIELRPQSPARALRARARLIAGSLVLAVSLMFLSSGFYASFIREHKVLRYYTNPATPIYSFLRHVGRRAGGAVGPPEVIGADAHLPPADIERELVIMVVGETARADRFSLNGYARDTNPGLSKEDVVSFRNATSCGTSTAVSVPCMFAVYDRADFGDDKAWQTENLLDVLLHAGVHILWRDNNSDSKGVALRVPTEDYRTPERNPVCNPECRDEGMLVGLQDYIDSLPEGDILIVLHQMGSHGPAYHKRYPAVFRAFEPTCETNQLDDCSAQEIGNTYDNTILYTDDFLTKVIALLRANDDRFETAMLYASDHGESLGEAGLYLHGLPRFVAPETQTRVPLILWFGRNYDGIDLTAMKQIQDAEVSHDHVFHTMLSLFEIRSGVYDERKDIIELARKISGRPKEYP